MGHIEVAAAAPNRLPLACRLALGNAPADRLDTRAGRLFQLVRDGRFDPAGLLLAQLDGTPVGAIAAQALPGGIGVVLPAYGLDSAIRTKLVAAAIDFCRRAGMSLIHCLLDPEATDDAAILTAAGFARITRVEHMLRHGSSPFDPGRETLRYSTFVPYNSDLEAAFAAALQRTYIDTLDLPETTVDRPASQQLDGYRHGQPDPPRWWLVRDAHAADIGVVMLSESTLPDAWEIAYLGLVPEARGRGLGRELMRHVLAVAAGEKISDLGLSVDARNSRAIRLYREHLFRIYEMQDLYLFQLSARN